MNEQRRIEILRRIAASGPAPIEYPDDGRTYWNGEPAEARRVQVIVGKAPPTWWCAHLEGTEREAVEVRYGWQTFYLDNEGDGSGWKKVTIYRGSPRAGHRSLPVARLLGAVDTPAKED